MKVLLCNQFFWPDTVATSQILTMVAQSLGEEHDVTVLCTGADLPSEMSGRPLSPRITIHRTPRFTVGGIELSRVASYLAYLGGVLWHAYLMPRPDLVVTLTTPPLLPMVGAIIARSRHARHVIWEMDVYPDIATDIGYFSKGGFIDRLSGVLIDWSRRSANAIIVLGDDMASRLVGRAISKYKIHVSDNWADGHAIGPMKFPDGPLTIHYSGNLGLAHEVVTITQVIDRLANHEWCRFVFAGGGPRRATLEQHCLESSIKNVEFRPYCSNDQLKYNLADGHLGLVTQLPQTLGSIVPSKIYGIMAAGRPLLYIGPEGSTPSRHISTFECGWRIQPGDIDGAVHLIHYLNGNRHLLEEAGARGRIAFEQHFDLPIGMSRVLGILLNSTSAGFHSEVKESLLEQVS